MTRTVSRRRAAVLIAATVALLVALMSSTASPVSADADGLSVELLSTVESEGAEIAAFARVSDRVFVTNPEADTPRVDVIDVSDPANAELIGYLELSGNPNSVAVRNDLVVVAVEGDEVDDNGEVMFFSARSLHHTGSVEVGVLPDSVAISPNGRYVVTANEAEPNDDYDVDPEGTISIIRMRGYRPGNVSTATFTDYAADELRALGVRIFGPDATAAQDLEPEYIAISDNSRYAYVTLQENNAIAVVDLRRAEVHDIWPLGFKDHSLAENAMDASNEDGIDGNLQTWPTLGMYQPDAIAYYRGFLYTANEGDARDYDGYSEEERVKDLLLDASVFPDADTLQEDENLGRLKTTTATGDDDGDGDFDTIYSYGARSMSVWNAQTGELVWDSGSMVEQAVLAAGSWEEGRSDDKGPEPEGVTIGKVGAYTYAFLGLERTSDVMVFDLSNPAHPEYVAIIPAPEGAISPEGLTVVSRNDSPTHSALLIVTYEVSGTTAVFELSN